MKTFSVQTLGCKVNQYEGEQLVGLLRARGLVAVPWGGRADLRVVHTCSVTVQAASKSRQAVRRPRARKRGATTRLLNRRVTRTHRAHA